jgi:hypothetical protein
MNQAAEWVAERRRNQNETNYQLTKGENHGTQFKREVRRDTWRYNESK